PVTTVDDRKVHERLNHEFHNRIVSLSKNRKLIDTYRSLNAHIKIARVHYSREGWEGRIAQERKEHNQMFTALKKRDAERLVTIVRTHIQRASKSLIEDLERNGNTSRGEPKELEKAEAV